MKNVDDASRSGGRGSSAADPPRRRGLSAAVREAGLQVDTAVRAAADVYSGGHADELSAAVSSALSGGGAAAYQRNLRAERARDAYDAEHRRTARTIGTAAAVAIPMIGMRQDAMIWSSQLKPYRKGQLGEQLSMLKTRREGGRVVGEQVRTKLSRGYTVADHTTDLDMTVEAKFGHGARLSPAQRRAVQELADRYRVDWWGPRDAGGVAATGVGSALTGAATARNRQEPR